MVSSAYLRLPIFLLAVLIPACASSTLGFHMMYSAYKLNKQGDNIQPCHSPFPVHCSMDSSQSSSNCCFLTCLQVSQEIGKVVWYSHLFKNFQFIVIHTVKGFSIVNEAKEVFLWSSFAFCMIQRMLAVWSLVLLPLCLTRVLVVRLGLWVFGEKEVKCRS